MAEQLGFTIRQRDIRPLDFSLSLIDALAGDGICDTPADLHRKFNELTGLNVSYLSWINQARKTRCACSFPLAMDAMSENIFPHSHGV